jgi:hypothetical protein
MLRLLRISHVTAVVIGPLVVYPAAVTQGMPVTAAAEAS